MSCCYYTQLMIVFHSQHRMHHSFQLHKQVKLVMHLIECCLIVYTEYLPYVTDHSKLNSLQETIKRWVTDDNGHNVLYMKNGRFRYNGFKLYRMITRTVTKHTPENQLCYPFFNQFKQNGNKKCKQKSNIMNIDILPVYYK
jgi:hypothetical protein